MTPVTSRREFGAALSVLALCVIYLLWSRNYPPDLGAVPALAAWLAIAFSLLDLLAQTRTRTGDAVRRAVGQSPADAPSKEESPAAGLGRELVAIAWPLGYVAALIGLGFLPMTPAYVFLYMWLHGRKTVASSLLAAAAVTLAIWVTFEVLFSYPLFVGLAFGGAG